jgi:hypothetical protein
MRIIGQVGKRANLNDAPGAGWCVLEAENLTRALLMIAAILALAAAGIYFMRRFRGDAGDDGPEASKLLTKFRELHVQGDLSDEEFRTIKTKLADQLQEELNDNDETG